MKHCNEIHCNVLEMFLRKIHRRGIPWGCHDDSPTSSIFVDPEKTFKNLNYNDPCLAKTHSSSNSSKRRRYNDNEDDDVDDVDSINTNIISNKTRLFLNDIRVFISNQLNHRMSVIESMKIHELLHKSSIDIEILQRNSIEQQEKIGDNCINRLTTNNNSLLRYDSAVSNRIGISSNSSSNGISSSNVPSAEALTGKLLLLLLFIYI